MKLRPKQSDKARIVNALTRPVLEIGMSKREAKDLGIDVIRSLGTSAKTKMHVGGFLEFRKGHRLDAKGPFLPEHMQEYLHVLAEEDFDQRYLDSTKRALELVFSVRLEKVEAEVSIALGPRSYHPEEVEEILRYQCAKNSFVTRLCFASGLRAHETFELRRTGERDRSPGRQWDDRLFAGMTNFTRYVVKGKGGLLRYVAIPNALAVELEARRLESPRTEVDRKITYKSVYDLGGGQAFSQSFAAANERAGITSRGAHGLRHSYAKRRFDQLKQAGFSTEDALRILSQELGHFRPEIVLTYLR